MIGICSNTTEKKEIGGKIKKKKQHNMMMGLGRLTVLTCQNRQ